MPVTAEWLLQPSGRQRWLDGAFLLSALLIFSWLLPPLWWGVVAVFLLLLMLWGWRKPAVRRLGCDSRGWWLEYHGCKLSVRWRHGSVRRADVLILEWSFWPWQRLMIRPDSLGSAEDYRRLTAVLYNDLR
ncbi:hypothetical protein [Thalassolituus sp. C2-1]|uniref:hypothetical protein n=1 Tax=Venatorbacter sp. C2-1 TaxID=2597518 RepID=UPI0011957AB3|nr:hypothetical protein [Thalassolituus sp. C2-1]TVV43041.1 hypothetical protein FOT50_11380 [Thalassolituus sp. C2-1]